MKPREEFSAQELVHDVRAYQAIDEQHLYNTFLFVEKMGKFGDDPGALRYVFNGLRMKMPPRLTFPIPYANLFTDHKDRTIFLKAMTKRVVCRTFYREIPEGVG